MCILVVRKQRFCISHRNRLGPKSIAAPCHPRQACGPAGIVPLEGFNPISPQKDAGIESILPIAGTSQW